MAINDYQNVLQNVQKSRKSQWFLNKMKIDWQPCINLCFSSKYFDFLAIQAHTTDALKQLKVLSIFQCQCLLQEPKG